MGLFRKFRDKRAKTKASAKEQISFAFFDSQSETDEISYTPGLIDTLQNDHAILGQQFQNLSDLFQG